jgi:hypothetical protein
MREPQAPRRTTLIVLTLTVMGCSPAQDERLADFARQAAQSQARQNERMAQQSQTVVQQSQRLTEAAQQLVEHDAEARRELVQAQHQLHTGVAAERAGVHRQREAMETERRELAMQRGRDPIILDSVRRPASFLKLMQTSARSRDAILTFQILRRMPRLYNALNRLPRPAGQLLRAAVSK